VEIFDNDIAGNKTANLIISSYYSTNYYNTRVVTRSTIPYPRSIFVTATASKAAAIHRRHGIEKLSKWRCLGINGISGCLWDGYWTQPRCVNGVPPPGERICVQNGETEF